MLFFSGIFYYLTNQQEAVENRLLDTSSGSYNMSKHARIRDLRRPFQQAIDNPALILFGRGPAKQFTRTDSHNEYGWLFQRYGLVGLICYCLIIYYGLRFSIMKYLRSDRIEYQIVYLGAVCAMINWGFFAMAENIFKQIQLMPLNLIALGLIGDMIYQNDPSDVSVEENNLHIN